MIPLYTQEQFDNAKSKDLLPCKCYNCNQIFNKTKKYIKDCLNQKHKNSGLYCSIKCNGESKKKKIQINCTNCNQLFEIQNYAIKRSNNHFCSQSCSGSYNNKHKKHCTRRSKLEVYLEEQLILLYPNLVIDFNKNDAISSELDIYIPSLNLAFELNGIFHYEPIYGVNKLDQIQNNDQNKFKLCIEHKIDLCVIDTSSQQKFKINTSKKYLDIITNIINQRTLLTS